MRAGTAEEDEHGLGAGSSIGRRSRVRPLTRFESSLFSEPQMWSPQRRMVFVGKRKCQATVGMPCLQEMERCDLCDDENQGGTASICKNCRPWVISQGRFSF